MTTPEEAPDRAAGTGEDASRDQLRALAHPLRLTLMERIGRLGTARAADLAAELGIPANSVSYHLRILARGGVVAEAPEAARDKRDRVWKLAQSSFRSGPGDPSGAGGATAEAREYEAASSAVSLAALDWMRTTWAARAGASGPDATGKSSLVATTLRISSDQFDELSELIGTTIMEFNRLNRDEHGADLAGDPDSEGSATDFHVLFTLVGDRDAHSPSQDS